MNAIIFNHKYYIIREVFLKEFGNVLIATTELSKQLMTENGNYVSREAQFVDEAIFYFVSSGEINLPDELFTTIVETQVI